METGGMVRPGSGRLFIVSGPSGVGKTVLCNHLVERFRPHVVYSISATSRAPRGNEQDGQEYFFISRERFEQELAENLFAEWAVVHGNYYGTPKSFLDENRAAGRHVVLNIDVQGALSIRRQYSDAVLIFVLPPSIEELERRIRLRNRDSEDDLRKRLDNARAEMACRHEYTHSVVNDDLDLAKAELERIFHHSTEPSDGS